MKNLSQKKKKIKVKNTVLHLLSAAMNHDDCPNWLKALIWNTLNDNADMPADRPEFYAECIKYSRLSDIDTNETEAASNVADMPGESQELEKLAAQISEVMKNPLTPVKLYNVLSDELSETFADTDSPEWILDNLKKMEAENEN